MRHEYRAGVVAAASLLVGGLLALSGCSAADAPTRGCTNSEACERGFACSESGQCDEIGCASDLDCIEGEACLQQDRSGAYSPGAPGLCTSVECSEGRGGVPCPAGQVCVGGLCYAGGGTPGTCECNTDCRVGQGCIAGACGPPAATCADDCECAVGSTCEEGVCTTGGALCGGVVCPDGETCVDDVCTASSSACNPPCGAGETCNETTGSCEGGSSGDFLCDACTADGDCGGEDDRCVTLLSGGTPVNVCGKSCTSASDCPSGYGCQRVDSRSGEQCVPLAGECSGCLQTGCPTGQFCNGASTECEPIVATCASCVLDQQCGPGAGCALVGGQRNCLPRCTGAGDCAEGSCENIGGTNFCVPDGGSCAGACDRDPSECTGTNNLLNPATCNCVQCITVSDCGTGQICSDTGACVIDGAPCTRISDCPVGQICDTRPGVNRCVQCITPGDCATGEICAAGICQGCDCPAGTRCTLTGECVATGNPDACTGPSDCVGLYNDLGGDPASAGNVECDSGGVGCYMAGSCNGSLLGGGGGFPLPIELPGFGGAIDPFDASCPPGTTCEVDLNLLGGIIGGDLFGFACTGCDPSNPTSCREGEVCSEGGGLGGLLGGDSPKCVRDSGGGGGNPFCPPLCF